MPQWRLALQIPSCVSRGSCEAGRETHSGTTLGVGKGAFRFCLPVKGCGSVMSCTMVVGSRGSSDPQYLKSAMAGVFRS